MRSCLRACNAVSVCVALVICASGCAQPPEWVTIVHHDTNARPAWTTVTLVTSARVPGDTVFEVLWDGQSVFNGPLPLHPWNTDEYVETWPLDLAVIYARPGSHVLEFRSKVDACKKNVVIERQGEKQYYWLTAYLDGYVPQILDYEPG